MIAAETSRQSLVEHCRSRLREGQAELRQSFLVKEDAPHLLRARCALVDDVLGELWQALALPPTLTLLAVGGYGRGELYPASDVDILLLLPATPDPELTSQVESAVALFYDIGLEIAPSVRTVAECAQAAAGDLTICTALLEARLLSGDGGLFTEVCRQLRAGLDAQSFFDAKRMEQEERHRRYQDSPYNLEPTPRKLPAACAICRPSSGSPALPASATPGRISHGTASSPAMKKSSSCAALASCSVCAATCTCMSAGARTACSSTIRPRSPAAWVSCRPQPVWPASG